MNRNESYFHVLLMSTLFAIKLNIVHCTSVGSASDPFTHMFKNSFENILVLLLRHAQ